MCTSSKKCCSLQCIKWVCFNPFFVIKYGVTFKKWSILRKAGLKKIIRIGLRSLNMWWGNARKREIAILIYVLIQLNGFDSCVVDCGFFHFKNIHCHNVNRPCIHGDEINKKLKYWKYLEILEMLFWKDL